MPIIKSAKKAMRSSARKAVRNRKIRGVYRSYIKKLREAVNVGDIAKAKELFVNVQKALDKAVKKKVLKKNTASRYKSRLNAFIKRNAN